MTRTSSSFPFSQICDQKHREQTVRIITSEFETSSAANGCICPHGFGLIAFTSYFGCSTAWLYLGLSRKWAHQNCDLDGQNDNKHPDLRCRLSWGPLVFPLSKGSLCLTFAQQVKPFRCFQRETDASQMAWAGGKLGKL